jgi:uncharacterized membrane protein YdjX (TVP38/TMEM64 family)
MSSPAAAVLATVAGLSAAGVGTAVAVGGDPTAAIIGVAYLGAALAALPVGAVTMIAGYSYGVGWGLAVIAPLCVAGAVASFAVGRTVLRKRIERRLHDNRRFRAIDRAIGNEGFRITLLVRLSPILPFGVLNYVLSATSVRPATYTAATALGTLPGTLLYVYLGSMAGGATGGGDMVTQLFWWTGLAATLLGIVAITRAARRALRQDEVPA